MILSIIAIAISIVAIVMVIGLKQVIKDIALESELMYKYTDKGIEFYDRTGKKILVKGEEL